MGRCMLELASTTAPFSDPLHIIARRCCAVATMVQTPCNCHGKSGHAWEEHLPALYAHMSCQVRGPSLRDLC